MSDPVVEPVVTTPAAPVTPAPVVPAPVAAPAAAPAVEPVTSLLTDKQVDPAAPVIPPVPVAYDLKVPDKSLLDAASVEKIASFAKDRGFSQEQAQALLERDNQNAVASEAAQQAALKEQSQQWVKDVMTDKEIGGKDAKQNVALAHRVIERFASPVLVQQLRETGLGNHPELLRLFVNVGKMMSDDQLITGSGTPKIEKSAAEVFYPNMTQKGD